MAAEQGTKPGQDLARFCAQLEDYTPTVRPFMGKVAERLIFCSKMLFCVDSGRCNAVLPGEGRLLYR